MGLSAPRSEAPTTLTIISFRGVPSRAITVAMGVCGTPGPGRGFGTRCGHIELPPLSAPAEHGRRSRGTAPSLRERARKEPRGKADQHASAPTMRGEDSRATGQPSPTLAPTRSQNLPGLLKSRRTLAVAGRLALPGHDLSGGVSGNSSITFRRSWRTKSIGWSWSGGANACRLDSSESRALCVRALAHRPAPLGTDGLIASPSKIDVHSSRAHRGWEECNNRAFGGWSFDMKRWGRSRHEACENQIGFLRCGARGLRIPAGI